MNFRRNTLHRERTSTVSPSRYSGCSWPVPRIGRCPASSSMTDPGVEIAVDDVSDEVQHDDQHRGDHQPRHQRIDVSPASARMKNSPMPSRLKTVSVTMAPPSTTPRLTVKTVTTGMSALRMA